MALPVKLEIGRGAGVEHFASQLIPKLQLSLGAVPVGPPDERRILQQIDLGLRRRKFAQSLANRAPHERLSRIGLHFGRNRLERAGIAPCRGRSACRGQAGDALGPGPRAIPIGRP